MLFFEHNPKIVQLKSELNLVLLTLNTSFLLQEYNS
jgi:hypothetical protein